MSDDLTAELGRSQNAYVFRAADGYNSIAIRTSDEELAEWRHLRELDHQGSNELGAAWDEGVDLIHEDSFVEHIAGLERETRQLPDGESWTDRPWKYVDWTAVAQDERSQYAELEFDGVTYLACVCP